jgi:hypothetical protein
MSDKPTKPKKLSLASTKKELLDAYEETLKQVQEKREAELRPEERREEKKEQEVVMVAGALSTEGIAREIGELRLEIGKLLARISDSLEEQVGRFQSLSNAIAVKEKELQELYGIEKTAASFAALLEAQNKKREEFDTEMATRKEELRLEIESTRLEWVREKKDYEAKTKERDAEEKRKRDREKEEFEYGFVREKQLARDKFEDEKQKTEKEIQTRKEQVERELVERERAVAERERVIAEREGDLSELEKKVAGFPKEMDAAVSHAAKDTTEKITLSAKNREELLKKEFEGERNVLTTRIEGLERTVKEQKEQITKLSQQLEKAYQKVEDLAVKTIEGSSGIKTLSNLQQLLGDQIKKQQPE